MFDDTGEGGFGPKDLEAIETKATELGKLIAAAGAPAQESYNLVTMVGRIISKAVVEETADLRSGYGGLKPLAASCMRESLRNIGIIVGPEFGSGRLTD